MIPTLLIAYLTKFKFVSTGSLLLCYSIFTYTKDNWAKKSEDGIFPKLFKNESVKLGINIEKTAKYVFNMVHHHLLMNKRSSSFSVVLLLYYSRTQRLVNILCQFANSIFACAQSDQSNFITQHQF